MSHPLDGPRAKIRRAETHLDALEVERQAWIDSNPYYVLTNRQPNSDTFTFLLHRFDDAFKVESDLFGLIVGDYVHNLRSALDHLVWQLVTVANKRKPKNRGEVYFPVGTSFQHFIGQPPLSHLTWEQVSVIEGFQSYRTGDGPAPLRDLHALWNTDKHRLVTPILVRIAEEGPEFEFTDCQLAEKWFDTKVALEGDAKIACVRVTLTGPEPKVQVVRLPVDVAFGEVRRPIQNLPTMRDMTRDIVERCAQFFD